MHKLTITPTEALDQLVWNKPQLNLTKESSATDVYTDFTKVPPMVIEQDALAIPVREIMQKEHTRMKIVVDNNNVFKGILPLTCLTEERVNKMLFSGDFTVDNLYVKHCMISKESIQSLDVKELMTASIGDLIDALQHIGHQYALVINHDTHEICGMVSANDISRALHITVDTSSSGLTFLDVFEAIV